MKKIVIVSEDGAVGVEKQTGRYKSYTHLGDIGVDVEIIDNRKDMFKESKEAETQYCIACEDEAEMMHEALPRAHTCGLAPENICDDSCRYTDGLCDKHGTGNTTPANVLASGEWNPETGECTYDTIPANEWREELKEGLKEEILTAQRMIALMQPKSDEELIAVVLPNLHIFTHNFIQNLLNQHSAHLVERIETEKFIRISKEQEIEHPDCKYKKTDCMLDKLQEVITTKHSMK